jgi:hypothetical protein
MAVLGDLLFHRRDGVDLDTKLRHQGDAGIRKLVEQLPESDFTTASDDTLTARIVSEATIHPLQVSLDAGEPHVEAVTMRVRTMFGDQIQVKGLRATKSFPFTGDRTLWYLRTNSYDFNPPHGTIDQRNLVLGIEVQEHEGDQAAAHIENSIRVIKEWLQRQEAQIAAFNASLPARVLPLVQQRRGRLGRATDLLKRLQG